MRPPRLSLHSKSHRSTPPHMGSKPLVAAVPAPSPRGLTSRATPRSLPDLRIGPREKVSLHHVSSPGLSTRVSGSRLAPPHGSAAS
ncbi:hypothetical protein NDU88_005529 [Pleurodeles waltl]|uniref:Uncharacterized protein n=1 Tax=Pleurodeles waltl TaxID=8319 RepID=A0AAV7RKF0_PLEWA|nr:hypothetical protein NDU88_005529 [Pleurodeles waltl]